MSVGSVAELREVIQERFPAAYRQKMLHTVPDLPVEKDRGAYLAAKAQGQTVLDIGCTGPLAARVKAAAATYYGVDRVAGGWTVVDLDEAPEQLPRHPDVTLVIASELLEHLANPGRFLRVLADAYRGLPIVITVPHAGAFTMHQGCEMVNKDHVAWYSYTTLLTLLGRYGFTVTDARWYNGQPHRAEGLIVEVRA